MLQKENKSKLQLSQLRSNMLFLQELGINIDNYPEASSVPAKLFQSLGGLGKNLKTYLMALLTLYYSKKPCLCNMATPQNTQARFDWLSSPTQQAVFCCELPNPQKLSSGSNKTLISEDAQKFIIAFFCAISKDEAAALSDEKLETAVTLWPVFYSVAAYSGKGDFPTSEPRYFVDAATRTGGYVEVTWYNQEVLDSAIFLGSMQYHCGLHSRAKDGLMSRKWVGIHENPLFGNDQVDIYKPKGRWVEKGED